MDYDLRVRNGDSFLIKPLFDSHLQISLNLVVIATDCFLIDRHGNGTGIKGSDGYDIRLFKTDLRIFLIILLRNFFQDGKDLSAVCFIRQLLYGRILSLSISAPISYI